GLYSADRPTRAVNTRRSSSYVMTGLPVCFRITPSSASVPVSRLAFSASAVRSAEYNPARPVPFGDRGEVERCFGHTYTRRPGPAWTPEVVERDREDCGGSDRIGVLLRSAQSEMGSLRAGRLTRTGLQEALDPGRLPGEERGTEVRGVVREERTVVALVRFRERYWTPDEGPAVAEQCYRLTRLLDADDLDDLDEFAGSPVTAAQVTAAPVAAAC
uniref:hypothetical protein n=1 Tax=Streptomyces prasinopilosus TaxID=67344 RepID=UPI000B0B3D8D